MSEFKITKIENKGTTPLYLGFPGQNWQTLNPGQNNVNIVLPAEGTSKVIRMTSDKSVYPWQEFYFYQSDWFNTATSKMVYSVSHSQAGEGRLTTNDRNTPAGTISLAVDANLNGQVVLSKTVTFS